VSDLIRLSDREREILQWAANGLSNKQIAQHLGIEVRTVRNHLYNVGKLYGTNGRLQSVIYGIGLGDVNLSVALWNVRRGRSK
jgi:DNA-binding CsgD family transcriptional regulator